MFGIWILVFHSTFDVQLSNFDDALMAKVCYISEFISDKLF